MALNLQNYWHGNNTDNTIHKITNPQKNTIESKQDKIQSISKTFNKHLFSKTADVGIDQMDIFLGTLTLTCEDGRSE